MHELITERLWIGNAMDARNPKHLIDLGVSAIVDLAYEESPAQLPRQLVYCRFPLNDGGGNEPKVLTQVLQTTVNLVHNEIPTLIACSAGMSRSPTIAAFTMALHGNDDPRKWIAKIGDLRSLELKAELWADIEMAYDTINRKQGPL